MKDKIKDAQRLISDAQGGKANIKGAIAEIEKLLRK